MTAQKTIRMAGEFLEGSPGGWDQSKLGQKLKSIWTGLVWENTVRSQRSLTRISSLSGVSRTSMFAWKSRWFELEWGDRHGFLVLFEEQKKNPRKFYEIYRSLRWLDEEYQKVG